MKSLFSFGLRLGYIALNVAAVLRIPRIKDRLAERIINETSVHAMLHEADRAFKAAGAGDAGRLAARDLVMLRLLYASGGRVSEICGLTWADCVARANGQGQVTLFGKGDKTRMVLLSSATWAALDTLRSDNTAAAPVFSSRKGGGHLSTVQVWRIIRTAAKRAGLAAAVSPHFMRHAHASHAIDRGAPLHTVQATLGHASVATTGRYLHVRPEESSALVWGCDLGMLITQ